MFLIEVVMIQVLTNFSKVTFVKMLYSHPVNNKLSLPSISEPRILINQYLILCNTLEVLEICHTFQVLFRLLKNHRWEH